MSAEELIKEIESVFDGIPRPDMSLRQFNLVIKNDVSHVITDSEWEIAGKGRSDLRWQDISDSEIEECDFLLTHMQAEELLYYLPAYMRYSVKNHWKGDADVIGFTIYAVYPSALDEVLFNHEVEKFDLLNRAQREMIVKFLKFVANKADFVHRPDAMLALERYWDQNGNN